MWACTVIISSCILATLSCDCDIRYACVLLILVDDVRHDVYLTLDHGVFNKGTKRADKNVEIDLEIIDEKEQIISVRISLLLNFLIN